MARGHGFYEYSKFKHTHMILRLPLKKISMKIAHHKYFQTKLSQTVKLYIQTNHLIANTTRYRNMERTQFDLMPTCLLNMLFTNQISDTAKVFLCTVKFTTCISNLSKTISRLPLALRISHNVPGIKS